MRCYRWGIHNPEFYDMWDLCIISKGCSWCKCSHSNHLMATTIIGTVITLELKPYKTSAQPLVRCCCTVTCVRRYFSEKLEGLFAFQEFGQVVLTASVDLHEKDAWSHWTISHVFWQERPLDPTRINRAERSTNNFQVDGLLSCNVLWLIFADTYFSQCSEDFRGRGCHFLKLQVLSLRFSGDACRTCL